MWSIQMVSMTSVGAVNPSSVGSLVCVCLFFWCFLCSFLHFLIKLIADQARPSGDPSMSFILIFDCFVEICLRYFTHCINGQRSWRNILFFNFNDVLSLLWCNFFVLKHHLRCYKIVLVGVLLTLLKTKNTKRTRFCRTETPHMMDLLRLHWSHIPFESITFKCHPFFPKKSKHFLAVENGGGGRKNSIFMSRCVFKSHQVSLTSHQDVFEGTYGGGGGWWSVEL